MPEDKKIVKLQSVLHETQPECLCPVCGYNYIHFDQVIKPDFNNEKSGGIVLHFFCESGHFFNIVIEDYKGNSYMTYTDENFNIIKPVIPENSL